MRSTLERERVEIVAAIYRRAGDLDLAEEALQEACARALTVWPERGLPDRPGAWLITVARNWVVDQRRAQRAVTPAPVGDESPPEPDGPDAPDDPAEDQLRLLFACCRADLPARTRVALSLRSILGLSTREIARSFLQKESAVAQRLVRAKRILEASPPGASASGSARSEAIHAVLEAIYLLLNEGYLATEGDRLARAPLLEAAATLSERVAELFPFHGEALALAALVQFQSARSETRIDADGGLIPLEEQDRSRWNVKRIALGQTLLARAVSHRGDGGRTGRYLVEAAIAALHAEAQVPEATDWIQIAALYRELLRSAPSPVVELNAAVAVAMAGELEAALTWVNRLERRGALADYHLLAAVKADLSRRAGHLRQARRYYRRARRLTVNESERRFLTRRIAEVETALESAHRSDGSAPGPPPKLPPGG